MTMSFATTMQQLAYAVVGLTAAFTLYGWAHNREERKSAEHGKEVRNRDRRAA